MFLTKQRDVGRRRLLRELREACPEGTRSYAIVDGLRVQDAKVWLDNPGMGQVLTRMGQVFAAAAVRLADEQATP